MEDKKRTFVNRALPLGILALGWLSCAYLAFRSRQLKVTTSITSDFCKMFFGSSCDKTLSSPFSWQLGFSLVGWGMVYFGLLALLFSLRNRLLDRLVLLIGAFGVGVSCILTVIILRSTAPCPLCLIIHFVNLLALITLFYSIRPSISYTKLKPTPAQHGYLKWGLLLLFIIAAGGFTEVRMLKSSLPKMPEVNVAEVARKFQGEIAYDIPASVSSPQLGSIDAPVKLVVFSSFQCPSCKGFASIIEDVEKKFGKNVNITFKNFPLSTKCNPRLAENMQPQSCDAAFAALAAHRQNRFWDYHNQVFQSNLINDEKSLTSIARKIGLNMEKWQQDRQSNEVEKQLVEDINTGYKLSINATPTVFINGRKVSNLSEKVLDLLIENELNKTKN